MTMSMLNSNAVRAPMGSFRFSVVALMLRTRIRVVPWLLPEDVLMKQLRPCSRVEAFFGGLGKRRTPE